MPVTAKLSRRFYEVLGEDVANELVDWFNAVDLTYRNDLRELNELNFARFDAKVEQRFAESEARLERRFAEFEVRWGRRFVELEARWDQRFVELEARWDQRFVELEARWEGRFLQLDAKLDQRTLELRQEILGLRADMDVGFERASAAIERSRTDLLRWMLALWLTSAGATILSRLL